jgi:hypothetical protein
MTEKDKPKVRDRGETEELTEAPGPEAPRDVEIHAGAHGTTILPVYVRDDDVDPKDASLAPDPKAKVEDTVIEGEQVEVLTGAVASNGAAISINGNVYVFNGQQVGALKQVVDRAVVGLAL